MGMIAHTSAEEHYRLGREDLREGEAERALGHFRSAHRLDPGSARYRSYLGLAIGLGERHWEEALELCRSAARDEFFDPVHYHNLAQLHLAFGFKAEAVRLLRRGLLIDPDNAEIGTSLRALGQRRRPPLGFLRRENALNRWLGKAFERSGLRTEPEPSPSL